MFNNRTNQGTYVKKILIVEDDLDIAEILQLILLDEGYEVSCLNRVSGFEQELKVFNPDLILLDISLPDGNGLELCKRVKNVDLVSPPVILMSAHAKHVDAIEAGADTFIEKPFDIDFLAKEISKRILPLISILLLNNFLS